MGVGADPILTICSAHHRAVHRGDLIIEGDSAANVRFRHADGRAYGDVQEHGPLDVVAKVFSALRQLGFRDAEVRHVLAARREGNPCPERELATARGPEPARA